METSMSGMELISLVIVLAIVCFSVRNLAKLKKWEIWMEGYLTSGMEGQPSRAYNVGCVYANSFQDACDKLCSGEEFQRKYGYYNSNDLTLWGCKLFDNEVDARKRFG